MYGSGEIRGGRWVQGRRGKGGEKRGWRKEV